MTEEKNNDQYKDTVFLPKTEFPMRGELPKKEPEILKKWLAADLYGQMRKTAAGKPKWVLHDGPPYANGDIHMGHALNKILKDVVVKSYAMMGYDAPYVPGWDCHGLPIEWKIEEKYRDAGKDKDDIEILQFRDECRKFAQGWVDVQSKQFQRLGVSGDWTNPYLTMTYRAESKIVREIHKFALNGGLYRGAKPVMWSVVEKTALAEAEVEYKEHKSITVWVKFPVVKGFRDELENASIVIWTTTPWTLPSNRAIAVNENLVYVVLEVTAIAEGSKAKVGEKIVVAEKLAEDVIKTAKIQSFDVKTRIVGKDLEKIICGHPLRGQGYDFDVPVLLGDFVTDDAGTGFVHIAPGHGEDDFNLVAHYNADLVREGLHKKRKLLDPAHRTLDSKTLEVADNPEKPYIEVTDNVADDGKFRDHVPLFKGLEVYTQKGEMGQGNFAVLKALDESGALLAKGSIRHEYPHSWRSKAPLIFRTTPQWFIAMENEINLRQTALKAIAETQWVPAKGETRIRSMIENRPDWCISRQRAWGVPIALFLDKKTKKPLVDEKVFNTIAEIFEREGADAWWSRPPADFLGSTYKADDYDQVFDIVDVWFESGSTHAFVVDDDTTWPAYKGVDRADLYLEGSDQHRGWFHSSLLESCGTRGHAPYKSVLTHGFVLDEKGYKMSKSDGNVVDPLKIMEESGADILRLWTMTSDYAEDIRIGKDGLKSTADLYRRIRNTFRYLLGALDGFTNEERVDLSDKRVPELERLVLHQLAEMDKTVRKHTEEYEFMKLARALHEFCNNELSSFYFDIRKDRLYCDAPDSFERRATRSVMAHLFECLVTWFAPILAFTADEAWQHRPQGVFSNVESVHLLTWPEIPAEWKNEKLAEKWRKIKIERDLLLSVLEGKRKEKLIGSSLEASVVFQTDGQHEEIFKSLTVQEWEDVCIVSKVSFGKSDYSVDFAVSLASGEKCNRCWKVLEEVTAPTHLCNRCTDAVKHQKKAAA
jgi:isoleucyl-tRNA synthetase